MGHGIPNLVNVDQAIFDAKVAAAMPSFAASGAGQMGAEEDMERGMRTPRNSAPMFGGKGAHGYIPMGGMFTILKVREASAAEDEWYQDPEDTMARPATESELNRDGINLGSDSPHGR